MGDETRGIGVTDTRHSPYARLKPVPLHAVRLGSEGFWQKRRERNRERAIPRLLQLLKEHGVLDNFLRLAGKANAPRRGPRYTDSDLYKWMEAVAYVLHTAPNDPIRNEFEEAMEVVIGAQGADGYLNTHFVDERANQRFSNMLHDHELYCAGHLFQAAIAHYRATGDRRLLDASIRYADYILTQFGPGKRAEADGHPEVEMALIELYRETGKRDYLEMAHFFLEQVDYRHMPCIEGHAVRALYYCCGLTDYYAETGDPEVLATLERFWQSLVQTKLYVTGGAGGRHVGESFGRPYELPNEGAYAETCAAIANVMWNWRMLNLKGEARFADLMELALYNAFLAGVSLEGDTYFYVNPLASNGLPTGDPWYPWARRDTPPQRQPWYDCTCCPPNVQRLFASLPAYFFSLSKEGFWIHLYDQAVFDEGNLLDGTPLKLQIDTRYPWEGDVKITIAPQSPVEFSLFLRIPHWSENTMIGVNGEPIEAVGAGSYVEIRRRWQAGDEVSINFGVKPLLLECNPRVAENRASLAIQRGPLIYCFESQDNPGVSVLDASLRVDAPLQSIPSNLLDGVVMLQAEGILEEDNWSKLYRPFDSSRQAPARPITLRAIPYYAWANRGPSAMTVWVRRC